MQGQSILRATAPSEEKIFGACTVCVDPADHYQPMFIPETPTPVGRGWKEAIYGGHLWFFSDTKFCVRIEVCGPEVTIEQARDFARHYRDQILNEGNI